MTCSAASGARSARSGLGGVRVAVERVFAVEVRGGRVAREAGGAGVRAGRVGLGMERGGSGRDGGVFLGSRGGERSGRGLSGFGRRGGGCLLGCGEKGRSEGLVEAVEINEVF